MASGDATPPKKLLLINPNSSAVTTSLIKQTISQLPRNQVFQVQLYTAPSGPHSINSAEDAEASADIVLKDLGDSIRDYDAFLVACYSVHPLVPMIEEKRGVGFEDVIGIFEASISASLDLVLFRAGTGSFDQFGIVTTGKYFEKELTDGAVAYLTARGSGTESFGGVQSIGLHSSDLHTVDKEIFNGKIKEATKRLVKGRKCGVVCLGCAGLVDMEDVVRQAIVEELGQDQKFVQIVDGIKAGIQLLEAQGAKSP